jgi:hypothetical protein
LVARAESVPRAGLATAPWAEAAALIWQGPLPAGDEARLVAEFVARGGQAVFFPPEATDGTTFAGVAWGDWLAHPQPLRPEQWRSDEDILANTLASGALPVGELEVQRSCGLVGDIVPLAALADGLPLVARVPDVRGIYFCSTLPRPRESSLAREGIVLYALLQRLIERGLEPLAGARQLDAGPTANAVLTDGRWARLAGPAGGASTEAASQAGVSESAGRLVAVNRPLAEDLAPIASSERIDGLFRGLAYTRVEGRAGRGDSIVQEIWRAFLIAMLLALVGEGILSLPRRRAAPLVTPALAEAAA